MSRNINDHIDNVNKHNDNLHKTDNNVLAQLSSIDKDVQHLKQEISVIDSKVDQILELLNMLTIFIEDAENIADEESEDYESNEGWLPEVNEWEKNHEDYEEDD
jgi:hypothetical protein